jgi:hypothetical protein
MTALEGKEDQLLLTMPQAYLVVMAGYRHTSIPDRPVLPSDLQQSEIVSNDLRAISVHEIFDRSKSDSLARSLTVLQVLWFVVQCIARSNQHLPLTELEVVTLAYASLVGISYLAWWHKPMDLRVPIERGLPDSPVILESSSTPAKEYSTFARYSPMRLLKRLLKLLLFGYKDRHYTRLMWSPETTNPGWAALGSVLSLILVGTLFGGIHIVARHFAFPTNTERVLWEVCSIIMTVVPSGISVFILLATTIVGLIEASGTILNAEYESPRLFDRIVTAGMSLAIATYICARLPLLILPFTTLRSLPPDVYRSISWVNYIPHIG